MRITKYTTLINRETKRTNLIKEISFNYPAAKNLNSPSLISKFLCDVFMLDELAEEYAYMIAFNTKMRPIGVFEISHGSSNCSIVGSKEIFERALMIGASNIILAHNHPSGDPGPSNDDLLITRKIVTAGNLLGVQLVDHIIIGDYGRYFSMREESIDFLEEINK